MRFTRSGTGWSVESQNMINPGDSEAWEWAVHSFESTMLAMVARLDLVIGMTKQIAEGLLAGAATDAMDAISNHADDES